jgi:hypothetical protein
MASGEGTSPRERLVDTEGLLGCNPLSPSVPAEVWGARPSSWIPNPAVGPVPDHDARVAYAAHVPRGRLLNFGLLWSFHGGSRPGARRNLRERGPEPHSGVDQPKRPCQASTSSPISTITS